MKGCTLEDKDLTSHTELWKYLYLKLIVIKRFQRLWCSAWPWYNTGKVNSPNRGLPQGLGISWQSSEDCLQVCFVGTVVGRNYVWCLVIIFIFHIFSYLWALEEQGGKGSLQLSFEVAMQATRGGRERGSFYGEGGLSQCNTAVLKLYCKSYWVL